MDNFNASFDKNFKRMMRLQAAMMDCGSLTAMAIVAALIWAALKIWGGQ